MNRNKNLTEVGGDVSSVVKRVVNMKSITTAVMIMAGCAAYILLSSPQKLRKKQKIAIMSTTGSQHLSRAALEECEEMLKKLQSTRDAIIKEFEENRRSQMPGCYFYATPLSQKTLFVSFCFCKCFCVFVFVSFWHTI